MLSDIDDRFRCYKCLSLLFKAFFSALPEEVDLKVTARLQMIAVHWGSCHCFLEIIFSREHYTGEIYFSRMCEPIVSSVS